jgi:purine-binding chemotaxis protein CheW
MDETSSDEAILVVFTLADGLYGVQVSQVREITSMRDTTPVPNAPYYVNGVTNLRGQVTTVTDLRRRFGLSEKERDDNTRIIIVEPGGVPIGMVVDSVSEVLRMPSKDIEPVPELVVESGGSGIDAEYIKGVGKLGDGELLILLDLEKVLAAAAS